MGRGGRTGGDLFGDAEPEDAVPGRGDLIPGLGDLIPGVSRPRRVRPNSPLRLRRRRTRSITSRRGWLVARLVLCAAVFGFGVLAMAVGSVTAAAGYGAAATMAAAPPCPAGTDLTAQTADCVGNAVLTAEDGAYSLGGEESVALESPSAAGEFLWPTYPGDAAFDSVIGYSDTFPVRAEFWKGDIVTLTAALGGDVQSVTTDANPANQGGNGLGDALMGVAFTELALLLLIGVRAFRYRWLRPGPGLRLTVSGLIVSCLGVFVTAVCLITQPAQVLLILTVAPAVTVVVLLLSWLLVYGGRRSPGGVRRPRRP